MKINEQIAQELTILLDNNSHRLYSYERLVLSETIQYIHQLEALVATQQVISYIEGNIK